MRGNRPLPNKVRILVAEDDLQTHDDWRETLTTWGYSVDVAEDGVRALELINSNRPHIVLADLRMPRKDGLELLHDIGQMGVNLPTIIISGQGDVPEAVEAIKLGAVDYLRKPIDPPHLRQILRNLAENIAMRDENLSLRRRLADVGELGPLIGKSLSMRRVIATIERIAEASASIVITGESGSGKELVARTIHQMSSRRARPYVGVNCAAIPETLMESELFGHERGAFTGAEQRREGCFEAANGGTLLLDEITEMKIEVQAKLLRVLEEHRLRRVGGNSEIALDVRVLAASNRDVAEAVREGKLREDLYYRLNVFTIDLPPLRERREDVPLLVQNFIQHYAARNNKEVVGIDDEALTALQAHPWPGNIRQLRNVIERALIVCNGRVIRRSDLQPEFQAISTVESGYVKLRIGSTLEEMEKELIKRTIEFNGGNKTRAAHMLGVSPKTLYNKLERYGQQGE
jgi:DNA-binding NtrC family response regulator